MLDIVSAKKSMINNEISELESEILILEGLRDSFREEESTLQDINENWHNRKNIYLAIEIVREVQVPRRFEGTTATNLKKELPEGIKAGDENSKNANNVIGGIGHQIALLGEEIIRLRAKLAELRRELASL